MNLKRVILFGALLWILIFFEVSILMFGFNLKEGLSFYVIHYIMLIILTAMVSMFYFKKQKVFLGLFWQHLHEKNLRDKARRLALFPCAIELIQKTKYEPSSKDNPNRKSEIFHRFAGSTPDNEIFFVQIKEDKNTKEKYFISAFPLDE